MVGLCVAVAGLDVGLAVVAGLLLLTPLPGLLLAPTSGLLELIRGLAGALLRLRSLGFPAGLLVVVLVRARVDGGFGDFLTAAAAPTAPTAPTTAAVVTAASVTSL